MGPDISENLQHGPRHICDFFKTQVFLEWEFQSCDQDMFPKSEISNISWSVHSEWAHIEMHGFSVPSQKMQNAIVSLSWPGCWDSVESDLPNGPPKPSIHLGGAIGCGWLSFHYSLTLLRSAWVQHAQRGLPACHTKQHQVQPSHWQKRCNTNGPTMGG